MRRRRADGLFDGIATFGALCAAASRAALAKRRGPGPAAFLANLEPEVLALERGLRAGTWRPGGYVSFEIRDPKRRLIEGMDDEMLVVLARWFRNGARILSDMFRRAELWIAAAGLFLAIITSAIATAWWAGSTLATKADINVIREELREDRQRSADRMEELRGYIVDHLDGHPIPD